MNETRNNSSEQAETIQDQIEQVENVIHAVRNSLAELLVAAGVDPGSTRASARQLGLNRGLIWRVSRAIHADPATAVVQFPGRASTEKLIEACSQNGASDFLVNNTRTAMNDLEDIVKRYSGDRKTLAMMIANAQDQQESSQHETTRRKLFEGISGVWGVQSALRLRTTVLAPNADDSNLLDATDISGYIGFRHLSPANWPMYYRAVFDDEGASGEMPSKPLDPDIDTSGPFLLREFCSPREPDIVTTRVRNMLRYELQTGLIGKAETTNCLFGTKVTSFASKFADESNDIGCEFIPLDTPVERVVFDMFVHESIGFETPQACFLDRLTRPHGYDAEEFETAVLRFKPSVRHLSGDPSSAVSPHIPNYPRMLRYLYKQMGWNPKEFVGYRVEVTYPPVPTSLAYTFPLLKQKTRARGVFQKKMG